MMQWFSNLLGKAVVASDQNPVPVTQTGDPPLPTGAATEAKQDTGNTSLSTIAGKDFATQATLAAVLAKIIAAPATEAKQPALGTAGTPSSDVISIQGFGYTGTSTVTRAANQTPYTIGDVVGGALTIASVGPSGGEVFLTCLRLLWNITALPAGMGSFTVHFYNATPPSAIADNSPFTLGSGDRSAYIGHIDGLTVAAVGIGTQSVQGQLSQINEQMKLVGGTSLYAYLVTNAAYTPAANSETASLVAKAVAV